MILLNGAVCDSRCKVTLNSEGCGSITLGLTEVLICLDDILSDSDGLSDSQLEKLLDVANEIQSVYMLRGQE